MNKIHLFLLFVIFISVISCKKQDEGQLQTSDNSLDLISQELSSAFLKSANMPPFMTKSDGIESDIFVVSNNMINIFTEKYGLNFKSYVLGVPQVNLDLQIIPELQSIFESHDVIVREDLELLSEKIKPKATKGSSNIDTQDYYNDQLESMLNEVVLSFLIENIDKNVLNTKQLELNLISSLDRYGENYAR